MGISKREIKEYEKKWAGVKSAFSDLGALSMSPRERRIHRYRRKKCKIKQRGGERAESPVRSFNRIILL